MSFEYNTTLSGNAQSQYQGFDTWNSILDDESRSRNSSTSLISPTSDLDMKAMNDAFGLSASATGKEMAAANYLHNIYGKPSSSSGSTSTSAPISGSSFQNVFNNGFPLDNSFTLDTPNGFMNADYQDCKLYLHPPCGLETDG